MSGSACKESSSLQSRRTMYFTVQTIWTLRLTESLGESKNDSKGRLMVAFLMAAVINVPLGTSSVKKKKKGKKKRLRK